MGNYESVKIVSAFEASFNLSGGKPHVSLASLRTSGKDWI